MRCGRPAASTKSQPQRLCQRQSLQNHAQMILRPRRCAGHRSRRRSLPALSANPPLLLFALGTNLDGAQKERAISAAHRVVPRRASAPHAIAHAGSSRAPAERLYVMLRLIACAEISSVLIVPDRLMPKTTCPAFQPDCRSLLSPAIWPLAETLLSASGGYSESVNAMWLGQSALSTCIRGGYATG